MREPDTRGWRKEHGLSAKAEAILLYSSQSIILSKLKGALHLHELVYSEPLANTVLVAAEASRLAQVVCQWQESLSSAECAEVRGALFESRNPSAEELARAPLHLDELDQILARMNTRWLVKLMAANSLYVRFQPLVSLTTKRSMACECLLRGKQDGTEVGAERLLSTARLLGMSHELDRAAWRAAIKQGRSFMLSGHSLFLNFTPSSVYNPTFGAKKTKALCQENGVDISQLVFEVTEAEKVRDLDSLKRIMHEYRAEGARIALDDLGSGYSSILHLADLRPDYVKLDQGLVRGAHEDYARSVLLKAITDAAHELRILVVAEGVETEQDLKFCLDINADLVQGYFLARPEEVPPPVSAKATRALDQWLGTGVLS
jgi:EAL domain-containing protein (putative c-di-GMP-specific phosphodiesterase class I)